MKILFLSDNFPPHSRGGAEINAFNLARAIKNNSHEVFVITATQDKSMAGESEYQRLKIFTIYSDYHPALTHYFAIYNLQTISEIKSIFQKITPDIVHAHNIHAYISYHALKVARKYAKGVFLTAHDTMLFSYGKFDGFIDKKDLSVRQNFNYKISLAEQLKTAKKRFNPLRNILIRYYIKYVDRIFTNTGILEQALNNNKISNTETSYYGTDIKNISSEVEINNFKKKYNIAGKKIILFGGRLSREKGGEVAVRALQYVVAKLPDTVMVVAGQKNEYARYMLKIAEESGIASSLFFTGWIGRDDMNLAFSSCNVVITPSIYFDTFNLFNLEAMASGKPVVGTCFGGTPEVIKDKETGFVVNPFNISMLVDRIILLLQDDDLARKIGEAGMKRAKEYFGMERQAKQILDWYENLLVKNKKNDK